MKKLIASLQADYPQLSFRKSEIASWSPGKQQVSYNPNETETGIWSLLHEVGHALLGHASFESDISLLRKEIEAWQHAKILARGYEIDIRDDHIEDCLDTYRDWLHKRSTCPICQRHGLQQSQAVYSCLNCQSTWKVTTERFCRPYRLKKAQMTN